MKRIMCVLLCIPYGVQAGFTDGRKNRLYLEVDAGAGGLWAGSGNPFFPRLKSRGNFVTEGAVGYDHALFWKGFSVGAFVGVGYGNVGATTTFVSGPVFGHLSLRDRGFVEGGVRFAQQLTNRLVGSLKIGVSGHRLRGYLSGSTSGASSLIGSVVVAAALPPNDSIAGRRANATPYIIPNGQQIGVVAAGNVVNTAIQSSGGESIWGYKGVGQPLPYTIPNGSQIGVVAAGNVVNAATQSSLGDGILGDKSPIPNGQQIGVVQGSASGGTTTSTPLPPQQQKLVRRIGFLLLGLGLDYLLSNRFSVGLAGDVSLGQKKTYAFTQGDLYAAPPTTALSPTYARIMVTMKYELR